MAARPERPNGCMPDHSVNQPTAGTHNDLPRQTPHRQRASSPPHDPPPLVGVQLVRPRLHRKRLRLRALQLDTSPATAHTGRNQKTGRRTVTPTGATPPGMNITRL
jgi:hypothetical protein